MNNMYKPNVDQIDSKFPELTKQLVSWRNIFKPEVQAEILLASGAISDKSEYDENTYARLVAEALERQKKESNTETFRPKASMFICPKLDATNAKRWDKLMPRKLSFDNVGGQRADIFISRLPKIFDLFSRLAENNESFELILLIGDSDFAPGFGYNDLAVQAAIANGGVLLNDELGASFESNAYSYKWNIVEFLNANRFQNGVELFTATTGYFGDVDTTKYPRLLKVVSLYEMYKDGVIPASIDTKFDEDAVNAESAIKYKYFQEEDEKYDPSFFRRIPESSMEEITRAKFQSYRDQGKLIKGFGGGILIADELPPEVKALMYRNKLIMLCPWTRDGDPNKNPYYKSTKSRKFQLVQPES